MNYFKFLTKDIHTAIMATVDENGLPVTCAVDIMDYDDNGLYFLTAKGKGMYNRLKSKEYVALTGIKGEDTLSSVAISINGKAKELGSDLINELFEKNSYMNKIYPSEQSRQALTVFYIYEGKGEWFDLSKRPIERSSFTFGNAKEGNKGYEINNNCIICKRCIDVCPQNCIDFSKDVPLIKQENCLHCGNCLAICKHNAVNLRG